MNKLPAPKLENIEKGIKFTTSGPDQFGKCRLVASLHVGSSVWFSESEAAKHPDVMAILKEKLKKHLLRQLYHDQIEEMHNAVNELMTSAHRHDFEKEFAARDKLMKLALYAPPAGFDDDEFDCGSGPNCGCEQFEFLLTSRTK